MSAAMFVMLGAAASVPAPAQTDRMLHDFSDTPDGANPASSLIRDAAGDFYGTTYAGGANGTGTVFKLDRTGALTVLHSFGPYPGEDGGGPDAGLIRDSAGNFYGTTYYGGAIGYGIVFKVDVNGQETIMHAFGAGSDGALPTDSLVEGSAGNFYGTTNAGGAFNSGTVFEMDESGDERVLYSFSGQADGGTPAGGLIRDEAGNLYGTTTYGGSGPCDVARATGCGVVFKLDANGSETVLHSFSKVDGAHPCASLARDSAGNLYGTTSNGGAHDRGVVFQLNGSGKETVLYSFAGPDGAWPYANVIRDAAGNLYGTTRFGGISSYNCTGGCGTVFEISPSGTETMLYKFGGAANRDGANPVSGLIKDPAGNLYGTTEYGGTPACDSDPSLGCGAVFRLTPQ
jgi:uncharacterized repeat protein (TIGR03803 family)